MGLFLQATTPPEQARVSALAALSLIVAVTGFVNAIGFLVGPVLAHTALIRLRRARRRDVTLRGRRLAIAALWVSYGALLAAIAALATLLIAAYAALPSPRFF